jgi:ATP-binding cassette subfamily B protein
MKKSEKETKTDFKYNLKTFFSFLKKYRLMFTSLLVVIFIKEAVFVVDKFIFKIIIDKGYELLAGQIVKSVFAKVLIVSFVVYVGALVVRALCNWLSIHLLNRVETSMVFDIKNKFLNHIVCLSHNFHTTHKTGSLISRIIKASNAVGGMTDTLSFNILPLFFQLTVVCASLIYFDVTSAIVILVTVVIFISFSFIVFSFQQKKQVIANKRDDLEKGSISNIFTNIDSIKYYGKENLIRDNYAKLSVSTKEAVMDYYDSYRWLEAGHSVILWAGTASLMYFALNKFFAGTMTIGTVVFIYTIYGNITGPLFSFIHGVRNYYRIMTDFDDLFQYAKIENEIKDKVDAKDLKVKSGKVEFSNVNFKYHKKDLFKNFSLTIQENSKVALVGHSGSGKTTLVKLLYRFYNLDSGDIFIDDINIKDIKQESLRSEMSIVPQDCVLFDDTIYNNIMFSKPDASKEEVMSAIKFAQLDKVIANFPSKEETIVGERGVKLSGGEKQRVSIARAILADKKILVLDEATSALDSQTEHEIQSDLEKLMKGRTSIIIAHRLSTIMKADKIVVMKDGQIVQTGNHQELIDKEGEYKHLWNLQKGGYLVDEK